MATSVPLVCPHCEEPIVQGDELGRHLIAHPDGLRLLHEECAMRTILGGINHLMGKCTCCGGTEQPDPPGMSRRDAARAASLYWRFTERATKAH